MGPTKANQKKTPIYFISKIGNIDLSIFESQ